MTFGCGVLAIVLWWLRCEVVCLRGLLCGIFNNSPCVVNVQVDSLSRL